MPLLRKESSLERACVTYALNQGVLSVKLTTRGWPDRQFLCPGGKVFFVEFKRQDGRTRELQEHWVNRLKFLGFDVNVIRSKEVFEHVLRAYRAG